MVLIFKLISEMYNSMNLVARRGHGCARPVGGARVVANIAAVGGIAVRDSGSIAASAYRVGASTNHFDDTAAGGRDSGAPALGAVQYQVCKQNNLVDCRSLIFFQFFAQPLPQGYTRQVVDSWALHKTPSRGRWSRSSFGRGHGKLKVG